MSSKKNIAEAKRLERLKKDLENQQKKLDTDKAKLRTEKKAVAAQKRKNEQASKEIKASKNKLDNETRRLNKSTPRASPRSSSGKKGNKKLEADLADAKSRLEKKSKENRDFRKQLEELKNRNKLLERQAKSGSRKRSNTNADKRLRQLQQEISVLKRKLKLAFQDLQRQQRYYLNQLNRFKNQQEKWIARQREAKTKKDIVIKYVFIDDVKTVKKYRKGKNKIKIKLVDGSEVVVHDVDVVEATEVEEAVDDEMDSFVKEIEDELKQTKKRIKKKKKKKNSDGVEVTDDEYNDDEKGDELDNINEEEEMPDTLDALNSPNADDYDEEEVPTQENLTDHILELLSELECRTRDLHAINEIYENEGLDQQDDALKDLLDNVTQRHDKWTENLAENNFENADDLPNVNKAWQDEIYQVSTTIATASQPQKTENYGFTLAPSDSAKSESNGSGEKEEQINNLLSANNQLLTELTGRIGDLKHLNTIYFRTDKDENDEETEEKQVEVLLGDLDDRHNKVNDRVNELTQKTDNGKLSEYVPSNNKNWRKEIQYTLEYMDSDSQQQEAVVNELGQRTKDLERVILVLNGDEPNSVLEEVIQDCEDRHQKAKSDSSKNKSIYLNPNDSESKDNQGGDSEEMSSNGDPRVEEDNDAWIEVLKGVADKNKNNQSNNGVNDDNQQSGSDSGSESMKDTIIGELLVEMDERRNELERVKELSELEDVPDEEIDNIIELCETRHEEQKNKLRQENKDKGLINDSDTQKVLGDVETDNKAWEDALGILKKDAKSKQALQKRNELYLNELNGRIADLIKVKSITDKKENEDVDDEEVQAALDSLFDSVNVRQKENQDGVKETVYGDLNEESSSQKPNVRDQKQLAEFESNDADWIDALGGATETITGGMKPKTLKLSNDGVNSNGVVMSGGSDEMQESKANDNDYNDTWWLDKDPKRVEFIDEIKISEDQEEQLKQMGSYVEAVLSNDKDDDAITPLYVPIPEKDNHHILSTLFDGVMICDLINQAEPNFIDPRCVNRPDPFKPIPLSKKQVAENAQLIMSSIKSLDIELDNYDVDQWFDNDKTADVLINIIDQIAQKKLSKTVNLSKHPELVRLAKNNEIDSGEAESLKGNQWIERWVNNTLNRPVKDPINNWNKDLYNIMSKLHPEFASGAGGDYDENEDAAIEYMVNYAKNTLGLQTNITADDLKSGNHYCQEMFAEELFDDDSGLSKLNKSELRDYGGLVRKTKNDESQMMSWINSMMPPELRINNLYRDLSSGIVLLKLLDRAQPGCVKWTKKNVKQKPKSKFDKFQNCNYAMDRVIKSFPFSSTLRTKGEDFVNCDQKLHQKQIHSFLWQLMRYHATKQLSQLSFGGKEVTEKDIVQWANIKISEFADHTSDDLSSFKDPQLTTCVFYSELLEAIVPDSINMSLVYTDLPHLKDMRGKPDKHLDKRLANARYSMSMVRRLGGELFVMPEDLVVREAKAVLSVFAAIMTLDMTGAGNQAMTDDEDAALNASTIPT